MALAAPTLTRSLSRSRTPPPRPGQRRGIDTTANRVQLKESAGEILISEDGRLRQAPLRNKPSAVIDQQALHRLGLGRLCDHTLVPQKPKQRFKTPDTRNLSSTHRQTIDTEFGDHRRSQLTGLQVAFLQPPAHRAASFNMLRTARTE